MFNDFKYIKVVNIIIEESLFKIQNMMVDPEQLVIRLGNTEESYKPPQYSSSEIGFQQE